MRKPLSLTAIALEQLAIDLYHDAIRETPTASVTLEDNTTMEVSPPAWTKIGTALRQQYRAAAVELIEEHK